jgi:hypothetical protein
LRIFNFDPADYREAYAEDGWVHIRGGIAPDFLEALREFVTTALGDHRVEGKSIGGKKDQALFQPPRGSDFPGEIFDAIASMCGLNRPTMTLSERHVKAYNPDVPPEQTAHKDRFASQVSVGLSIEIPTESRLVLYPVDDVEPNPFNVSAALLDSLPSDQHPDLALHGAREVEVDDAAGDVVAFRGSAMWHFRRRAAGAVNLYLKMNDFGSDPLEEDPATPELRQSTIAAISSGGDDSLGGRIPVLSRRLDTITRGYLRDRSGERVEAHVWGREPLLLSESQLEFLQSLDGRRDVETVLRESGSSEDEAASHEWIRSLAEREVIDLLSEPIPS